MKQNLRVTVPLLAFLALLFAACPDPAGGGTSFVAVTGITGVPTDWTAGLDLPLSGTVAPENATYKTIAWSVKDEGTTGASISGNTLTTTTEGTAVVTAAIADGLAAGTPYTQDFSITFASFVAVTSITDVPAIEMPGMPLTLTGTVEPANATCKTIVWSVKNAGTTGASISGNTLTTTAEGTVEVTATIADGLAAGTPYTQDFSVTFAPFVAVTGITGVPAIEMPGTPLTLTGTVAPANATYTAIVWTVKDAGSTGASISGNMLTTTAAGTAAVTATIADGLAAGTPYTQDFSITIGFATPAPYRDMILATPNDTNTVTITGDSAYASGSNDYEKGVFIAGRTVTLSPFKIAKYETTYELWYEVKQWATAAARGANGYTFANAGREGHNGTDGAAPTSGAKTEPVTYINWRDAVIWCNAYSEMSGKEPVYYTDTTYTTVLRTSTDDNSIDTVADLAKMKTSANGYRLPTEAQWEYAARGGKTPSTSGTFVYTYAGSNTAEDVAWYLDNTNGTQTVGGRAGNTLGLYDMSGNVWEWCWDWYESPVGTGGTDPAGRGVGSFRVFRGGACYEFASRCAVAFRSNTGPKGRIYNIGFRVVARP
jgi:formylglycine-generating enzyme required for sulfatase activity